MAEGEKTKVKRFIEKMQNHNWTSYIIIIGIIIIAIGQVSGAIESIWGLVRNLLDGEKDPSKIVTPTVQPNTPIPSPPASPTPAIRLEASIISPKNNSIVNKDEVVKGLIYGLGTSYRAFVCVQTTAWKKLIYPQGEVIPNERGQWDVTKVRYQSPEHTYKTYVVATNNSEEVKKLSDNYYKVNGMPNLPKATKVISPTIFVTRNKEQ